MIGKLIFIGIILACMGWVVYSIYRAYMDAPEGYEDENGWHEGKEPIDEDKS